jgi:pimeloyl-ACP methyl ester carboxylesterase
VHGWGGWWQQLAAHLQPLLDAGLCVVAFDAPSHGASDPGRLGPRSSTVVEMAEALTAVEREFGRATVVVAHSLGSMAALHARGLGLTADSYVLLAPPDSVDPMIARFSHILGVGPRTGEQLRRRVERRAGVPLAALDLVALARRIPTPPPLLVIHDRSDRETLATGSLALAEAWTGSELVLTEGFGHRRLMWEPDVIGHVARFAAAAAQEVRRSSR